MNIGIVGSRTWTDTKLIARSIEDFVFKNKLKWGDVVIVSGGARGADTIAENFAQWKKLKMVIHYPQWKKYGKEAGIKRNFLIVADCEYLFCFWDGKSKGCMHSVKTARKKGIDCTVVERRAND